MSHLDNTLQKFGLVGSDNWNRSIIPPFEKMNQEQVACRCSSGHHTVWTNSLWGNQPTCHCKPNSPQIISDPPDYSLTLENPPKGWHWYFNGRAYVLARDTDILSEISTVPAIAQGDIFPNPNFIQNVKDFVNENKLLVSAGVLGLGYMFFSGGLSASDRTVTSITRFSPKRKNPSKKRRIKRRR